MSVQCLKDTAFEYWKKGHAIVTLHVTEKTKRPLVEWKKWIEHEQTEEELNGQPWNQANGFAIICGRKLKNGLYIAALDLDLEKGNVPFSSDVLEKQKKVIVKMPVTLVEQTPSGGHHLIYYSRQSVKTESYSVCGIEVLGEKKLCIMAPSEGYMKLTDNLPTELDSLKNKFLEAMKKAGLQTPSSSKARGKKGTAVRYCCEQALKRTSDLYGQRGHLMRLAIAAEYKKAGYSDEEIVELFRSQTDFDYEKCLVQVRSADPAKVASCKSIKRWGFCYPECPQREPDDKKTPQKKGREKVVPKKASGLADEGFFEAISNPTPQFLVQSENGFDVVEKVHIDGKPFKPKEPKHYPYKPYGYYEGEVPSKKSLYNDVRREFETFLDLESVWKDVLSVCVLLSYQQEKLVTSPYLYFYGDNESGKTTALNVLDVLCYRPMFAVSVPAADVYGYLEDADTIPTILEDEVQGVHKDRDKIKIYKSGYKRGAKVPRTILLEHDRIIKYYHTFSFKAFASEKLPSVKGFTERCLFISMTEGYPEKEWADLTTEDFQRFESLRNKLLKWRLQTRNQQLPGIELPFRGRVKELWKPLLQISYGLPVYETLFAFVDTQIKERLERKQSTLEGHIIKAVVSLYDGSPLPFSDIWDWLLDDLKGKVDEKKFHKMFAPDFEDPITKRKVGFRLREVLSGERKLRRESNKVKRVWNFDKHKLRRIAKKYGYEFVTKLPMVVTDVTDVTDERNMSTSKTMEKLSEHNVKTMKKNVEVHPNTLPLSVTSVTSVTERLMFSVKNWCRTKRDERGEVSLIELSAFVTEELKQDSQRVIQEAFKQAVLMPSNKPGKAVVV